MSLYPIAKETGNYKGKKLTREEFSQVLIWLVELKSAREISELIEEKFGKKLNYATIWQYTQAKKWKPIIARLRKQFEKDLLKIPIANKADRLLALQRVVDAGFKPSLKTITPKGIKIYEKKIGAVIEAVKAARDEMAGVAPLVDNSTHNHFTYVEGESLINEAKRRGIPIPAILERKYNLAGKTE